MPQPSPSDVHVDALLTNVSVAYMQAQKNFVAGQVFPMIPVDKQTNKYPVFTKNDWLRDEAERRPPGTESAGGGFTLSTDSYSCDVFAFHKDIDNQTRNNADSVFDLDRLAAEFVAQKMLLRREIQWVTDFFTTGIWGTDKVGTTDFTKWSDFAGSDPLEDIEAGKEAILSVTGFMPNTLLLGYQVFRKLKNHPDFVDRIKYTSDEVVTADIMARYLEIDRVLVAKAVKATNAEGDTAAYAFTHGKNALLAYVNPQPAKEMPSAGYGFGWTGVSDGLGETIGTSSFYMQEIRSDRVESEVAWDNKVVATDLGYFFSNAVA